ncbi:hypothetical protein [Nonomuraea indica]|uniref:hypothetical protein n=1 Tax=Nonomuraea indica TaxID=1581193 RepID=UPI000C7D1D4D|nr:hypothetical protein [Nonomuraea indica]
MPAITANRVWTVRKGSTGDGPDLFCVYAPTMDAARASASDSLDRAGLDPAFTVHAHAPNPQLPPHLTLARNLLASAFTALPAA